MGQGCDILTTCYVCNPHLGDLKAASRELKATENVNFFQNWGDSATSGGYTLQAEDKIIQHITAVCICMPLLL